ncbi:MAG TPA: hypothetical protein VGG01_18630 [Xanthobacteraceae bacterium]|jgi:hypothetical protein
MNTTIKLALAAALFSGLAFPAFAVDQGSEQAVMVPANAYASATWTERHHAPAHWSAQMSSIDFQAEGSR